MMAAKIALAIVAGATVTTYGVLVLAAFVVRYADKSPQGGPSGNSYGLEFFQADDDGVR